MPNLFEPVRAKEPYTEGYKEFLRAALDLVNE